MAPNAPTEPEILEPDAPEDPLVVPEDVRRGFDQAPIAVVFVEEVGDELPSAGVGREGDSVAFTDADGPGFLIVRTFLADMKGTRVLIEVEVNWSLAKKDTF